MTSDPGTVLRNARVSARMTQGNAADALGVSQSQISRYESRPSSVSAVHFMRLMHIYSDAHRGDDPTHTPSAEALAHRIQIEISGEDDIERRNIIRRILDSWKTDNAGAEL